MRRLDLMRTSLDGSHLIEASAGTGKTYTISSLYLRLVVEAGYEVEQILVVTYTNAAADELRQRIRAGLIKLRQDLQEGKSDDAFIEQLISTISDRQLALLRLNNAILGFDLCSVYTIHGFCQTVLTQSAYESGLPLKLEILHDESALLQQVVDNYWDLHIQDLPVYLLHHLRSKGITPDTLSDVIQPYLHKPYLTQKTSKQSVVLDQAHTSFVSCHAKVRKQWQQDGDEVAKLLLESASLNRNRYRKSSVPGWIEAMHRLLSDESGEWFDRFDRFTQSIIDQSIKKDAVPLQHSFFEACEELQQAKNLLDQGLESFVSTLYQSLINWCNVELRTKKLEQRLLSFDDMLLDLHRRVVSEPIPALLQQIRDKYQAVLIDEFQDTDPIQYEIFNHLFSDRSQPLYLVGDPKQAIYSFRGADIFAYLKARDQVNQQHTLGTNWRSTPALVSAVNHLFGAVNKPFLFQQIQMEAVEAASIPDRGMVDDATNVAPVKLSFATGERKSEVEQQSVEWLGKEVVRLLRGGIQGSIKINGKPLCAGDIAILVRTHRQAEWVRQHLAEQGVYSVLRTRENVFHSEQAVALEKLLLSILEPRNLGRLNAVLATDLIGKRATEVLELGRNEAVLDDWIERFYRYQKCWQERGFMSMFKLFQQEQQLTLRLLRLPDGERRLTNLLHLSELLHQYEREELPGMEGLVKWFDQCRQNSHHEDDARLLRLESDDALVQIVTIHRSKGLQYPVVFCPFAWEGLGQRKDALFSFHDPEQSYLPTLDLGSEQQQLHQDYRRNEQMAEALRLLYVAITRAELRCYLLWSGYKDSADSPLSWVFSGHFSDSQFESLQQMAGWFKGQAEQQLENHLSELASRYADLFQLLPVSSAIDEATSTAGVVEEVGQRSLEKRVFNRRLYAVERVNSFSGLIRNQETEAPDYDAVSILSDAEASVASNTTIHGFPRGANAGSCLHHIFENIDFKELNDADLSAVVLNTLTRFGIDQSWEAAVSQNIRQVLAADLDPKHEVRLKDVSTDRRLVEMEFYFPVTKLRTDGLVQLLLKHGYADDAAMKLALERLSFAQLSGFLKGFIDLIFESGGRYYLVDYKSNWLGADEQAYRMENMRTEIARHHYFLQYLIYTLGLHRYLKQRLEDYDYDKHFGSVCYLFLRGISDQDGSNTGIYRDRPSRGLIEALDRLMEGGGVTDE